MSHLKNKKFLFIVDLISSLEYFESMHSLEWVKQGCIAHFIR